MSITTTDILGESSKKRARIEIIPLIDVIFFLLATFVLFTLALNQTGGLRVDLPPAETGSARDNKGAVTITITAEGTLAWDKTSVTLDEFIARLKAWKLADPNGRILINGHEKALFQQVRYVVDEVRKAGISKIHIETRLRADAK
jgi:biopolymer transport protein ExbD